MKYYFGFDGSQTQSHVKVINETGEIIMEKKYGTCHLFQCHRSGFEDNMSRIRVDIEGYFSTIKYFCFGVAGYTEIIKDDLFIERVIHKYFGENVNIVNSLEIAHYGSLGLADGIHVVSDRGSIALSRRHNLRKMVGGWGYLIGDEGSSYAIGLEAIKTCILGVEDNCKRSILLNLFEKNYNFNSKQQILSEIYDATDYREKIVSFAPLVYKAAKLGCHASQQILKEQACYLVRICDNLLEKNHKDDTSVNISYSGCTFNSSEVFMHEFCQGLKQSSFKYNLVKPKYTPIDGALLYTYCFEKGTDRFEEFSRVIKNDCI